MTLQEWQRLLNKCFHNAMAKAYDEATSSPEEILTYVTKDSRYTTRLRFLCAPSPVVQNIEQQVSLFQPRAQGYVKGYWLEGVYVIEFERKDDAAHFKLQCKNVVDKGALHI